MPVTRTDHNQTFGPDGALLAEEVVEVDVTAQVVEVTLHDQARAAMATLQAIIDSPQVTFTTLAQAQTQMRQLQTQVKDEARLLRRLVRLAVSDLTAAD